MSLSEAIIGGAGIAMGMRKQRLAEREVDLNEAYRRDLFSENKRQFGLEHTLARDKHTLDTDKFADFKTRDDRNFKEEGRQFDINAGFEGRRVNVAEGQLSINQSENRRAQSTFDQDQIDNAALAQVALIQASIANGTPLDLSASATALFQNDATNRQFGKRTAGDPNFMNANSDKSKKPIGVAAEDGSVTPVYNMNGQPVPMDDNRDNTGPITRIPGALVVGQSIDTILQSPKATAAYAQMLMLNGLISEEAAKNPQKHEEEIVKAGTEAAARASAPKQPQPPQANLAAPPTTQQVMQRGLEPVRGVSPATAPVQPAPPPSLGYRIGAGIRDTAGNFVQDAANFSHEALYIPRQAVVGAGQLASGLLGLDQSPAPQQQQPAPAAPPAVPPPAAPPPPDQSLAAPRSAVRDIFRMKQLGLDPDQVTTMRMSGGRTSDPTLLGKMIDSGDGPLTGKERTQARQRLIDQYFKTQGEKDFKGKNMRSMAPGLVDLADNITQGAISAESEMGHSVMSQLQSLSRRAQHDDDYARELNNNPHMLVGLAIAGVNPATVGKEEFEKTVERLADLQNTQGMNALAFAKQATELLGLP